MANEGLFYKFLLWREKHIKEKHFILIISFIVGLCTAAAALILKHLIHLIQHLLTGNFNADGANYLYLLYPVIGILLTGLFVKYIVRDDISHGVTKILYAISQRKSRIKPHNVWSSIAASSVTIGFGGSVGAEAPIVLTGAAFQLGAFVPDGAEDTDAVGRMRGGGGRGRNLQGSYRRVGFRDRGIDARPDDDLGVASPDIVGDGGHDGLYLHGYRGDVPFLANGAFPYRPHPLRHSPGYLLRACLALFHACDEPGGRYVSRVRLLLEEVRGRWRDAERADFPFPSVVWRGLQYDRFLAGRPILAHYGREFVLQLA